MSSRHVASRRAGRARPQAEALEGRQLLTVSFSTQFYAASAQAGSATIALNNYSMGTSQTAPETVTVALDGGTAVPGVDYTPGNQTVTVGVNDTNASVTIPLLPGTPAEGTRVLQLDLSPSPGSPPTSRAYLVITHNADTTPPVVVSTKALTRGPNVTGFVLTFNKDMAPGPASDVNNYVVLDPHPVRPRRGQLNPIPPTIPLKSAVYDPATHSVTLTPLGKVRKYPSFSVVDRASFSQFNGPAYPQPGNVPLAPISPITDTTGNPLGLNMPMVPMPGSSPGGPQYSGTLSATVAVGKLGNLLAGFH